MRHSEEECSVVADDNIGVKKLDCYELRNMGYLRANRASLGDLFSNGRFRFTRGRTLADPADLDSAWRSITKQRGAS